jgi:Tol biopolymer transport system component
MRLTYKIVLLIVLILILGMAVGLLLGNPRLVSTFPAANANGISEQATLKLVFSRPMQDSTVMERLSIEPPISGKYSWEENTLLFKPDQPWPGGETITVTLRAGSRAAGMLAMPSRGPAAWSFTIARPRLIYLYPADGLASIYILDPVSGEKTQLTDDLGVTDFDISRDERTIFYTVKYPTGGSDIFRLDLPSPDTGQAPIEDLGTPGKPKPALVLKCPQALCRAAQISPQGDFLAYERTAFLGSDQVTYPQVWMLPLSPAGKPAASQPQAILAGDPGHQTLQPAWSSDGLLAFYDTNSAAYIILNPRTGTKVLFLNQTGQMGAWDSSGQGYLAPEISFPVVGDSASLSDLNPPPTSHLIHFDLKDKSIKDLSRDDNLEDTSPAYSPDGSVLAFARKYLDVAHWTPGRQIWVMKSTGDQAHPLTNDPDYNHFNFAWSPDNKQLAYVRFNQTDPMEPSELWMVDLLSTHAVRLVVGGYAPQWIP